MELSRLLNRTKDLVRTFDFTPAVHAGQRLRITLKHRPKRVLDDDVEKARVRLVGRSRFGTAEALEDQQREMQQLYTGILADLVVKIQAPPEGDGAEASPVKVRHLQPLLCLSVEQVGKFGGLDAVIEMDPTDPAQKSAKDNIKTLIAESGETQKFVSDICGDVSWFQDEEWEKEIKNSVSGVDSSSAPLSQRPPGTAESA